jgi:hypothetical protein
MTARANYVLIRRGEVRKMHNNLGAYEILPISALGPDVSVRFLDVWYDCAGPSVPSQTSPAGWNVETVAEGGLLVDCDRSVLSVFTIYTDYATRAAYLHGVARTWPGWQTRWAYHGIADLVAAAGDDPQLVRDVVDVSEVSLGHQVYGQHGEHVSCQYLVSTTDEHGRAAAHSLSHPPVAASRTLPTPAVDTGHVQTR